MDKFNLYIDKIDLNFWRELCTKEGKLRSYKKVNIFFIVEKPQNVYGDSLNTDISSIL